MSGQRGRLHLNCDCGERGVAHPDDLALVALVDCVNIACGGHAGDADSARDLAARAVAAGTTCCLHPAYPDPPNFGRRSLSMTWDELAASLDTQRAVLPTSTTLKFHGALYNDAAGDAELAERLAGWAAAAGLQTMLAPPGSALAAAAAAAGLTVWREGFADRRYELIDGRLQLRARQRADAQHADLAAMLAQVASVVEHGELPVLRDGGATTVPFACDTWCIHSDTPHAVALAEALRAWEPAC